LKYLNPDWKQSNQAFPNSLGIWSSPFPFEFILFPLSEVQTLYHISGFKSVLRTELCKLFCLKFSQIYPITAHWFPLSIGYLIMKFGNFPPDVRHFVESRLSKPGCFIFCTCQSIVMLGTTLCFWFFENHSLSIFCVFQHI